MKLPHGERARKLADAFRKHQLLTFASAISFRSLVALVPLTLLALAVLGGVGQSSVWTKSLAPRIEHNVTKPVYEGINASVEKILKGDKGTLIAIASVLLAWHMTGAVVTVMEALNRMHDVDDKRRWSRKLLVALALAATTTLCIVAAVLVISVAPTIGGGVVHFVLGLGRWLVAAALLGVAVGALVRYAPAEHPRPRWASGGSIGIITAWLVMTLLFKLWIEYVSNFKTATGQLTAFLILSAYVFLSVTVFLAGVQVDELLRREQK
ncbi:MAG TPA: YihY/virulence factor BrkB family protein [Gaiellaceae bacterium]